MLYTKKFLEDNKRENIGLDNAYIIGIIGLILVIIFG